MQRLPPEERSLLPRLKCLRCGHEWIPRSDGPPRNCPNKKCNSPYWDRERKVAREGQIAAP